METTRRMTKALLLGAATVLFTFALVSNAVAQVSWWPFDETSGTTAADIQDGNPGMLINGPTFTPGLVGNALSFDGIDDYVEIVNASNLNFGTGSFTVEAWVNQQTLQTATGNIMNHGASRVVTPPEAGWNLAVKSDQTIRFALRDETGQHPGNPIGSAPFPSLGEWHHVALVVDRINGVATLFVDCASAVSVVLPADFGSMDVNIGNPAIGTFNKGGAATGGIPASFFHGLIDEVKIYNRALSASEIQAIFNAGSAGKCKVEPATFLIIDEDSIDNGNPPNFFSDVQVNDDIAETGVRTPLPAFADDNVGTVITLHTGEVGDEGWFALKTIPDSWAAADPDPATDTDGLTSYILAGPGLGTPDANGDREALLDKIPDVTPLRATGLKLLEGQQVCAVVYDSDININYNPLDGSLKGANLGTVAFEVLEVRMLEGFSSSSLPEVDIEILDAEEVCEGDLELCADEDCPAPISSSEPFDVEPPGE